MSKHASQPDLSHSQWHDSLTRGHEPDVMQGRWIVIGVGSLVATGLVTAIGVKVLLRVEANQARDADQPRSVVDGAAPPRVEPSLQPTQMHDRKPEEDLAAMKAEEDRLFSAIGWSADERTHEPTIPDAIVSRVAKRPTRTPTTAAATRPAPRIVTPIPAVDEGAPQ